jgi:hypothetical protein
MSKKKNRAEEDEESRIEDFLYSQKQSYTDGTELQEKENDFNLLTKEQKHKRAEELWEICVKKSLAGALIIDRVKFMKGNFALINSLLT